MNDSPIPVTIRATEVRDPRVLVAVRAAEAKDAAGIAAIYNHYVTHTVITFEEQPVSVPEIERRIEEVHSASLPWLVVEDANEILGYAYAAKWRTRSAYRHSAEVTIYVDPRHARRGIGSSLYARLFPTLEILGIHAVMAGIALPNEASVALHEMYGMQKVAHFAQVGFKLDRWIDVGYWQRLL